MASEASPPEGTAEPLRRGTLLVLDDDPVFRGTARVALSADADSIVEAESVQSGLLALERRMVDLAIVDVHLPDGTAADFIKHAGATPCLLITQDDMETTFRSLMDDPGVAQTVVGYVVKPLTPNSVFSIRATLRVARARHTASRLLIEATTHFEAEKRRIARDLHDEMGTYLTQLRWVFEGLEHDVLPGIHDVQREARAAALCREGKDLVLLCHQEASRAISRLRPESVATFGLIQAIRFLVGEWERSAPSVDFRVNIDETVDQVDVNRAGSVYYIVAEGLSNAMRHTKPTQLLLAMQRHTSSVEISITSIGVVPAEQDTYALTTLRERTLTLGGVLRFECSAERGETSLAITIPI